ncbi:MAG: NAD-dependent malic enzyme [Myxococcales bacterium]|jgi:malate dehydrogenase (oxaloacetate-decarboxylating)|nr:NAD-dependent malic enzyme [Myxococcales bacterium]MBP8195921.1 NAD-dependent malic enzyme [Deltaproteobacteria bacterium]
MAHYRIDTVLRVRTRHRPGQLARVATVIAQEGALIGEISTLHMAEGLSTREITVETENEEHTERLVAALARTDGVEIVSVRDRVFDCHRGGKLHSTSRVELQHLSDLRYIYTPGVARVSRAIAEKPERAFDYTGLGRSVGIFTNGTRVLGLGDIGPVASLPVMEGKAVLYDRFAGLSATPILVDTKDVEEFVQTVVRVSRSFGGIHLEDIRIPECFRIEEELKRRLRKPVMHDDQHGTAVVTLAAIINVCRLTGIELRRSKMGQVGLGAAGSAIAKLALAYGVGEVMVTDRNPAAIAPLTAAGAHSTDLDTLLQRADIVVCTTGKVGLIKPEQVRRGQVIFALSNPYPEIDPDVARDAGAAYAADGAAINNALAFPGIFRGALAVRAGKIEPQMYIAAAEAIAASAGSDEVVPSPLSTSVHDAVTDAVSACATSLGLANTAEL